MTQEQNVQRQVWMAGSRAMKLQSRDQMPRLYSHSWVQILAQPLAGCVPMGGSLAPRFLHLKNGHNNSDATQSSHQGQGGTAREVLSPVARNREHFLITALISHQH